MSHLLFPEKKKDVVENVYSKFYEGHKKYYKRALTEILVLGYKKTHWIWYLIPTPPYIVKGVEKGSEMNRKMAIRTDQEACAYMCYDFFRNHYITLLKAIKYQLDKGKMLNQIMGQLDSPKVISSILYFNRITDKYKVFPDVSNICKALIRALSN